VELDRKVLADIAVKDAAGFTALAEKAKNGGGEEEVSRKFLSCK